MKSIIDLKNKMSEDVSQFEIVFTKKSSIPISKVDYVIKFKPRVIVTNPLSLKLIEFIKVYDKLISCLKLLRLAGCFELETVYWDNVRRYQKIVNSMLSDILLSPSISKD